MMTKTSTLQPACLFLSAALYNARNIARLRLIGNRDWMIMRCAHGGRRRRWIALLAICWWLCAGILPAAAADDAAFAAQLHAMQEGEFAEKDAAEQMQEDLNAEHALPVIQ